MREREKAAARERVSDAGVAPPGGATRAGETHHA